MRIGCRYVAQKVLLNLSIVLFKTSNRDYDAFSVRSLPSSPGYPVSYEDIKTEPRDLPIDDQDRNDETNSLKSFYSRRSFNNTLKVHGRFLNSKLMELRDSSRRSEFTFLEATRIKTEGMFILDSVNCTYFKNIRLVKFLFILLSALNNA